MALTFEDVGFSYDEEVLFSGFSFSADLMGLHALLGPSGCGKNDSATFDGGTARTILGENSRPAGRRLPVSRTTPPALEDSRSECRNSHRCRLRDASGEKNAPNIFLELVGLKGKGNSYPDELSGGQRQRVAMARAFAYPSPLILLDEPFQSLDLPLRLQLMDLFKRLLSLEPRAGIMVTHDPREAIYLADRISVLAGKPVRIVLDEHVELSTEERSYSSSAAAVLEARLFAALAPAV